MVLNALPDDILRVHLDTAATVPAEVQLRFARAVLEDLHTMEGVETDTVFSIYHLGHGSTLLEVILAGLGAAVSVGTFAVALSGYLRDNQGEAGPQCSYIINNYDGSQVTITTANKEPIIVSREELPAPENGAHWFERGTAFSDNSRSSGGTGFAGRSRLERLANNEAESSGHDKKREKYKVFGVLDRDSDGVYIHTSEGRLRVGKMPSNIDEMFDLVGEFDLLGPGEVMTSEEHDITNLTLRRDIDLETLKGRMVERHQGRIAEFETDEGS